MGLFMAGFLMGGLIGFAAAIFMFAASDEEYEDDDEQEG